MSEKKAAPCQQDVSFELGLFIGGAGYNDIEVVYEALNLRADRHIKELLKNFEANDDESAAESLEELRHVRSLQGVLFFAVSDKLTETYQNWHRLYYDNDNASNRDLAAEREARTAEFIKTYRTTSKS